MRIYSMTATFGKLENQTLTFDAGLNVIHAPNEWGKSTWCAFLTCMLYGIATKDRSTPSVLADKDHYAPWSGKPMSGRIDLNWDGRDITIERTTKGRVPFGEFKAYETASGVCVPELTAANCGELLLGAEKSVFTKSAFIRMTDMPVADSEALRHRLNALVTTGDEHNTSDDLAEKLKGLRNRCRHNRTGLLPQAEAQLDAIDEKLRSLKSLHAQSGEISQRIAALDEDIRLLKNHKIALEHAATQKNNAQLASAIASQDAAEQAYERQLDICSALPSIEKAEEQILHLGQLQLEQDALYEEALPAPPKKPEISGAFVGLSPNQAVAQARRDFDAYRKLFIPRPILGGILAGLCLLGAAGVALRNPLAALPFLILAIVFLTFTLSKKRRQIREQAAIAARYPGLSPDAWVDAAQSYAEKMAAYHQQEAIYLELINSYQLRKTQLSEAIESATGGCSISECLEGWRDTIDEHSKLSALYQAAEQTRKHAQALASFLRESPAPTAPDPLIYSEEETRQMLEKATADHLHLEKQHSACLAQMEIIGQQAPLEDQRAAIEERIRKLQDIYDALTLALETLTETAAELQRKFAPKISARAQALFSQLTGGRYPRLMLTQELRPEATAQGEDTLRNALWRSDGTADQLYFALRLAVSEELLPECPLVLDDALLRFDDTRLRAAMEILKKLSTNRQIILFTCHERESACL